MAFTASPPGGTYAWWNLNKRQKRALQAERLAGRFGGRRGVGAGRAPYFWVQEYGSEEAAVVAQHFAEISWQAFLRRSDRVIRDYMAELMRR